MRVTSVETTPNPNSIKLNLDESAGPSVTYSREKPDVQPGFVAELLSMKGLQSVFVCGDFITLNKDPRFDWREILACASRVFEGSIASLDAVNMQRSDAEKHGQVHLLVQTFRGVPIQVKVVDQEGETRVSLGARFNEAAQFIQEKTGADFLKERYWADHGVRYGGRAEIADEVCEEIRGVFDEQCLERLKNSEDIQSEAEVQAPMELLETKLCDPDWRQRLSVVQELSRRSESVSLLVGALRDEAPQVRRLAAAALGAVGNADAVGALCEVLLQDASVAVRRTAGDALSDLGDQGAQAAMCEALRDSNKLVRWRAARFLSDLGTEDALTSLQNAVNDSEFEVRLEVTAAIERITGGGKGVGPAWKRISEL